MLKIDRISQLLFLAGTLLPGIASAQTPVAEGATVRLDEVVVTVQKRADRLLDVPISVASVTADDLRQSSVVGLFDLLTVMPGVRIDHYGAYAQPTVRGIGTQDVQGPGANANVAMYVDGYYLPSQSGNIFDFANISRIEVLKGPQGTLFGQNATGGAILVTTPDPSFDPNGSLTIGMGSFDEMHGKFYGSTGFGDRVAVDLSAYYRESDNYFDNISTDEPTSPIEHTAVRSKLLWQATDATKLVLTLEYSDLDNATGLSENTIDPIAAFYHDVFGVPMEATTEPYKTALNAPSQSKPVTKMAGLTGTFELSDDLVLTSLTQYRDQETTIRGDLDGTTIQYWQIEFDEDQYTFTQEFNLAGGGDGKFDWVAGVFFYNDNGGLVFRAYNDYFNTGVQTNAQHSYVEVDTESLAGFADGTYQVSDNFWLTAGMRYTSEKKTLDSQGQIAPFVQYHGSETWDEFTPRLAARWALSPNSNIYASASMGFMSGNYSYTSVGPQEPVDPENATQYEVGYKFASSDVAFDAAAYYIDYEDLQVFRFADDCGCYRLDNAPKAEVYGVEAGVTAPLTDRLTLGANVAWMHARYVEYNGLGISGLPLIPPNYGVLLLPTDFDDGEMIRAPDFTANLALNYEVPTDSGTWGLSGNYYYTSEVPLSPAAQLSQDAYGLLSLRGSWTSPNGSWTVSVFGNNVTDEEYLIFSGAGFLGNNRIHGAPASWGAELGFRF
jgi:iron complex outermembrane receptor protein